MSNNELYNVPEHKIRSFLAFFREYGDKHAARFQAGINHEDWDALNSRPEFKHLLDEAERLFFASIQIEMIKRAKEGTPKVLTYKGEVMYQRHEDGGLILGEDGQPIPQMIYEKSDKLLIALFDTFVKTAREEDRARVNELSTTPDKITIEFMAPKALETPSED
jgi:hypothetical protein